MPPRRTITWPSRNKKCSAWCETLLAGRAAAPDLTLADYIRAIPGLASLAGCARRHARARARRRRLPSRARKSATATSASARWWTRCSSAASAAGSKSSSATSAASRKARSPKWPSGSANCSKCDVPLIGDWLDESSMTILPARRQADRRREAGRGDHARKHAQVRDRARAVEGQAGRPAASSRRSWPSWPTSSPRSSATIYVFEALSAGSLDACSVAVPAAMERVALGEYVAAEFTGPMMRCLDAQLVVFSGLKIDKLDDLEAMIDRGKITRVFAAGALSGALRKAAAELDGKECCLGVAEDPAHNDQPYLRSASADRAGQADDRRRPQEGHQVRPAGRLRHSRRQRRRRRSSRATSSSTSARRRASCSSTQVGEFMKLQRRRRVPQRRVRHVRRPALRRRHAAVHPAAQADDRQRRRSLRRRRRRRRGPRKIRRSQTGSRTSSPPAAPCSTPWAANRCRTWWPCARRQRNRPLHSNNRYRFQ